jgi:hypothetical protein
VNDILPPNLAARLLEVLKTYGVLIGPLLVHIWLPYWVPAYGRLLRRSEGPWLENFDSARRAIVLRQEWRRTAALNLFAVFIFVSADIQRMSAKTTVEPLVETIVSMLTYLSHFWIIYQGKDRVGARDRATLAITLWTKDRTDANLLINTLRQQGALIGAKRSNFEARLSTPHGFVWFAIKEHTLRLTEFRAQSTETEQTTRAVFERLRSRNPIKVLVSVEKGASLAALELTVIKLLTSLQTTAPIVLTNADGAIVDAPQLSDAAQHNRRVLGFSLAQGMAENPPNTPSVDLPQALSEADQAADTNARILARSRLGKTGWWIAAQGVFLPTVSFFVLSWMRIAVPSEIVNVLAPATALGWIVLIAYLSRSVVVDAQGLSVNEIFGAYRIEWSDARSIAVDKRESMLTIASETREIKVALFTLGRGKNAVLSRLYATAQERGIRLDHVEHAGSPLSWPYRAIKR